jgi:hypothetical protein
VRETETLPRRLPRLLARRRAALGGRTQLLAAEKAPVVLLWNKEQEVLVNRQPNCHDVKVVLPE